MRALEKIRLVVLGLAIVAQGCGSVSEGVDTDASPAPSDAMVSDGSDDPDGGATCVPNSLLYLGSGDVFVAEPPGTNPLNLTNGEGTSTSAFWSWDGSEIGFVSNRGSVFRVYVMNADGTNLRAVTEPGENPRAPKWVPQSSRLSVVINVDGAVGQLITMDSDGGSRALVKDAVNANFGMGWSPDGSRIVYSRAIGARPLAIVGADGLGDTLLDGEIGNDVAWAPDGSRILFTRGNDIMSLNPDGTNLLTVTGEAGFVSRNAAWTPNQQRIIFTRFEGSEGQIFSVAANGTERTNLSNSATNDLGPEVAPDGTTIAFTEVNIGADNRGFTMNLDGTGKSVLEVPTSAGGLRWRACR